MAYINGNWAGSNYQFPGVGDVDKTDTQNFLLAVCRYGMALASTGVQTWNPNANPAPQVNGGNFSLNGNIFTGLPRARYHDNAGQAGPFLTTPIALLFDVQDYDSDSAVTNAATAWTFTCPVGKPGPYLVAASALVVTAVAPGQPQIGIYKNGTLYAMVQLPTIPIALSLSVSIAATVPLVATDTVQIKLNTSSTQSLGISASVLGATWVSIQNLGQA